MLCLSVRVCPHIRVCEFATLTEANPAEMVVALLAVHVVASTILVDGHLALGAVFRELHQPGRGRTVLLFNIFSVFLCQAVIIS